MIPMPAKVANATQTHHATASVGSHGPWWVRMDVGPNFPAQNEEHQYIEQPQEININPADAFVPFVSLIAFGLKVMEYSLIQN
jgi:hypothetical protein